MSVTKLLPSVVDTKGNIMPLEYGIHFNVAEEIYFAEPCLSTSALKELIVSRKDFWDNSWMNPDRPVREQKNHLDFGKAVHSYILEPDTISKYAPSFIPPAGCLKTVDDLKKFLDAKGEKYKSSTPKPELIQLAYQADPDAPVYEALEKKYYEVNAGKQFLPAEDYEKLGVMKKLIQGEKEFLEIFQDSVPEVTLIFQCPITGIKMKARLDALALHIADLKTFSKKSKQPINEIVKAAFRYERYDIQFFIYDLARTIVFENIKAGRYGIFGEHNPEWLQYIMENYNDNFYFGFIESSRPYNVRVLDVERWRKLDEEHNLLYMKAEGDYEDGVRDFVYCMETFGPNKPWRDEDIVLTMGDKDLPLHFLESK